VASVKTTRVCVDAFSVGGRQTWHMFGCAGSADVCTVRNSRHPVLDWTAIGTKSHAAFLISLLTSCLIYARALLEYVIISMSQVAFGYQDVTVREIRG